MQVITKNIKDLISAEYNPRQLKKEQFNQLKDSIKRFGLVDPVIINKNDSRKNIIIGGHQRTRVAESLGIEEVPCVEVDLTLDEERELNVRLNKNTGEWDFDILADMFDIDELKDWGFTDDELLGFELEEEKEGNIDDDEIPEVEEAVTKLGDLWILGEHRLLCGDATKKEDVDLLMDGNKADMVFVDPPYGVDYKGINNDSRDGLNNLLDKSFKYINNNSKQGSAIYCFHSDKCSDIFSNIFRVYFHFSSMIIWYKNSLTLSQTDYQSQHEPCLYGWVKDGTHNFYGDRKQTSVWEIKKETFLKHSTNKPVEFITKAINNSSKKNNIVLDSFLGSGSTLIACEKTDRKCYGMELDPHYCDVIVKRWEEFTGKKAELYGKTEEV